MGENFRKYWNEMHQKHPDALLLFRHGDFYEVFGTDAVECGKILDIKATQHADRSVTAGFPYHSLDTYLPKLIRAGKRVAICDYPIEPPKRGNNETIETTSETKSEETMQNEKKAADLIGKTIVNKEGTMKYHVKGVAADGETLQAEFATGSNSPVSVPLPKVQWEKLLAGGWTVGGAATATAADEVEEVEDVQPTAAKTVTMEQPKPKAEPKPKASKPKTEPKASKPKTEPKAETKTEGKLRYETYTNKKGKQCAKIIGFGENDPAYVNAADLHGSASYERDKQGEKTLYLVFGPKYAAAAKQVCDALNAGKPFADCKAIVDKATDDRHAAREEARAKREERKAQAAAAPNGKTYTEAEVADLIKRVVAGDKEAMDIVNAMQKAA